MSRIRIPVGKRGLFSLLQNIHNGFGTQPASYYMSTGFSLPEVSGWGVTLITHLQVTPKLRMR